MGQSVSLINPDPTALTLVNVASLGKISCPSSLCPLNHLLNEIAGSHSDKNLWASSWSFHFAPIDSPDLKLTITLARPVLLSKVQLLCGGGMSSCPSRIIVEVSTESEGDGDVTQLSTKPLTLTALTLKSLESWIRVTVQLEQPKSVKKVLLHVYKPEESDFVYLSEIRVLEHVPAPPPPKQITEKMKMENLKKFINQYNSLNNMPPSQLYPTPANNLTDFGSNLSHYYDELNDFHSNGYFIPSTSHGLVLGAKPKAATIVTISPKSLKAYHHFINKLPRYTQVLHGKIFNDRAQLFVWIASGKGEMNDSPNTSVDTLPYEVLSCLLENLPLSTEDGRNLRRIMVEEKAIDLVLEHMADLSSSTPTTQTNPAASTSSSSSLGFGFYGKPDAWAKGTGFGVGFDYSCSRNDVEHAFQNKQDAEEMIMCLLDVLNIFISSPIPASNELDEEPDIFPRAPEVNELLKNSCLIPLLVNYLRNDSVLDIAGHFPLYRVILRLLRSTSSHLQFRSLLVPSPSKGEPSISDLLFKMKDTVESYARLLQTSINLDQDLLQFTHDIERASSEVEDALKEFLSRENENHGLQLHEVGEEEQADLSTIAPSTSMSLESRYVEEMERLRFEFQEMIGEEAIFKVPYHYRIVVQNNWTQSGQRISTTAKRLAQEAVTLQKSLPVSWGSSIFVRCDNDRLDVMKVLITGPAGTPYANGCFEFDIHFPLDYPNSPPMVNFETTGGRKVRFNPNLYEDGKVCLSILNTWPGSPEEQWSPKTSSLLLVLVAIQSLIFVEEPYWNEPLHQIRSRPDHGKKSREYSASVRCFTLQYAILDQIRRPSSCFKEVRVIHRHFWMKREEILAQCQEWVDSTKDMDWNTRGMFMKTLSELRNEILKLSPPEGLEDLELDPRVANDGDWNEGACCVQ